MVTGTGNTAVTWSISPNVGTISQSGQYTAPPSIASAQPVTVTATSVADPTRSATAIVNLGVAIAVFVTPSTVTLTAGSSRQFSATVAGSADPVDGPVIGGHAILTVAARPPNSPAILLDFVHLRIDGTNPTIAAANAFVDGQLPGRNSNILHMVRAIFAHESGFHQFAPGAQTATNMTFSVQNGFHRGPLQPNCRVHFDWPDDPPNFPVAAFDFGLGFGQITKFAGITLGNGVVWNWRENAKESINHFFGNLRNHAFAGLTFRQWAKLGWKDYNGSQIYADTVAGEAEGQQVSNALMPSTFNRAVETANLNPGTGARRTSRMAARGTQCAFTARSSVGIGEAPENGRHPLHYMGIQRQGT